MIQCFPLFVSIFRARIGMFDHQHLNSGGNCQALLTIFFLIITRKPFHYFPKAHYLKLNSTSHDSA
jgi:hypothetical protein